MFAMEAFERVANRVGVFRRAVAMQLADAEVGWQVLRLVGREDVNVPAGVLQFDPRPVFGRYATAIADDETGAAAYRRRIV